MIDVWRSWFERWEQFQQTYVPHRDAMIDAMLRTAESARLGRRPRILDMACGPGSIALRMIDRWPGAEIAALDVDPLLLEIGRHHPAASNITWIEADLTDERWCEALNGTFDLVIMVSALRWIDAPLLDGLFRQVLELLVAGGSFLVSDAIVDGDGRGLLSRSGLAQLERWVRERGSVAGEDWVSFWQAARDVPEFAGLITRRSVRVGLPPPGLVPSSSRIRSQMIDAGFADVAEIWRWHAAAAVAARRRPESHALRVDVRR